jgi:hypothetical protein
MKQSPSGGFNPSDFRIALCVPAYLLNDKNHLLKIFPPPTLKKRFFNL